MKKGFFVLVMALILMVPSIGMGEESNLGVEIDGKRIVYSTSSGRPFVDNAGRTQVPFRQTMEEFGCTVSWDQAGQKAVASKDGTTVVVPIGENYVLKNGVTIKNDTAALIQDGRTYLPIRVVLESFGAKVSWDAKANMVVVQSLDAPEGKEIQVHFLDVGQADAILIDDGNYEVLIDGGTKQQEQKVVSYLSEYVDSSLDVMIATHTHEDHIGGLPAVFSAYTVGTVVDNGLSADTKIYEAYKSGRTAEQSRYLTSSQEQVFSLPSGGEIRTIPMSGSYNDPNDASVIVMLDYGETQALFMGDASKEVEKNNLKKFTDVDVLKAGHHGSRTAGSTDFLNQTKSEYVIISAGLDNRYGHPHAEALSAYFHCGAVVYGTYRSGDIVMTTDGRNVSFSTSRKLTMADVGGSVSEEKTESAAAEKTSVSQQPTSGVAYIGNRNSMIFHKDSCSSVKRMSENNKVIFKTAADAVSSGYRGCQICNP